MWLKEPFEPEISVNIVELEQNQYIIELLNGYIETGKVNDFLDKDSIIQFEMCLFFGLDDNSTKRVELLATKKQQDELSDRTSQWNLQVNLRKQKSESFDILVEVISMKYSFKCKAHAILVIYILLWKLAATHFTKISIKKYEPIFPDIADMNLRQCVERYLDIDLIDPMNEINIGLLAYFMIHYNKSDSTDSFLNVIESIHLLISECKLRIKLHKYESKLLNNKQTTNIFTINDVDLMTGLEFEDFIVNLFKRMGYETSKTPATGDQGIDVVAEKHGIKIGIQAKCYSKNVTNSAIQEVTAGVKHYRCDKAIVATNNVFTKSAIELAHSNNVVLWDRAILKEKISDYMQGH